MQHSALIRVAVQPSPVSHTATVAVVVSPPPPPAHIEHTATVGVAVLPFAGLAHTSTVRVTVYGPAIQQDFPVAVAVRTPLGRRRRRARR